MSKKITLPRLDIKGIAQGRSNSNSAITSEYKKVDEGSITPRTFELRKYEKSLDDAWFEDTYKFGNNSVTSYRINRDKIPKSKEEEKNIPNEKKILGDVEVKIMSKSSTVNTKNYTAKDLENIKHTNIEKQVFLRALNYLSVDENKVVLVDILEREKLDLVTKKVINKDVLTGVTSEEIKHIETHTVVLYKQTDANGQQKIIVIDPNNFIFSSHLKVLHQKLQEDLLNKEKVHKLSKEKTLQKDLLNKFLIETKHEVFLIYKPGSTGYRDCVDIAVKIALNLMNSKEAIELDKVKNSELYKLLSNQTTAILKANPVTIKQTSSIETVKKFNDIESKIDEKLKNLVLINADQSNVLDKEHEKILSELKRDSNKDSTPHNKDVIKNILEFSGKCTTEYTRAATDYKTELDKISNAMTQEDLKLTGAIDYDSII